MRTPGSSCSTRSIFKGDWAEKFDAQATREEDFLVGPGRKQAVAMMHKEGLEGGRYGAFNADGGGFKTPREIPLDEPHKPHPGPGGFQIAELPDKGKELSMVLAVPRDADGLAAIEKRVTTSNLKAWLAALEARTMDVVLPKFRLETAYGMQETLGALGMSQVFTGAANFDGMVAAGSARLSISEVFHKVFVEVTEKGTEAAAATAVVMMTRAAPTTAVPVAPVVRADRRLRQASRERALSSRWFRRGMPRQVGGPRFASLPPRRPGR
jgi:serpin B